MQTSEVFAEDKQQHYCGDQF